MIDYAVGQITHLLSVPSPTGYTFKVTDYLMKTLSEMGFSPVKTRKGAVMCDLGGEGTGTLLASHVDTLGAMVRSVKANGRLRYTHIGGWQDATVETENCTVFTYDGKEYSGTVQHVKASQHVYPGMGKDSREEETMEIVLDENVSSAADTEALGIRPGCFIAWDPRTRVTSSGFIKSRHLDDKASSGILLALAKGVKSGEVKLKRHVTLLFSVYEEVGHGASMKLPEHIRDMLAVDMGCVGDDLGCRENMVSICAKDSAGPYDHILTHQLISLAKENRLSYAVDVYPSYSSDCSTALRSGNDIRYALIGPGVFASHGYERTHLDGIRNTLMLVKAFVESDSENE